MIVKMFFRKEQSLSTYFFYFNTYYKIYSNQDHIIGERVVDTLISRTK